MNFNYSLLSTPLDYDGSQLRELFPKSMGAPAGHAAIAFIGSCQVDLDHLVDSDDAHSGRPIYSPSMLHLILEFFGMNLWETVLLQRMLMVKASELLLQKGAEVTRSGDDIYMAHRKLSVSIATASRVSTLVHVGFNLDTAGTPVPTVALSELGFTAETFAVLLLDSFKSELECMWHARCKVWGV
ncbi:DUF366 family protein [Desulfurispira natronophila]|uniref:DUF366 family protein n=1 Tax=Desulfurispira natronophila TaxID=682562 RepID=A0A7W7Y3C6_9BACT|nr:hypothetical protein [Desulfurispira natronophila]